MRRTIPVPLLGALPRHRHRRQCSYPAPRSCVRSSRPCCSIPSSLNTNVVSRINEWFPLHHAALLDTLFVPTAHHRLVSPGCKPLAPDHHDEKRSAATTAKDAAAALLAASLPKMKGVISGAEVVTVSTAVARNVRLGFLREILHPE